MASVVTEKGKEQTMKILVDEMPCFPDDDCMFCDLKWDEEEKMWFSYCKLINAMCDLNENKCSCLGMKGE